MKVYTHQEWIDEAKRRFGDEAAGWRFVCPSCGHEQTPQDLLNAGIEATDLDQYVAFSCIGRFDEQRGCKHTLGGLFKIHEAEVEFEDGSRRPVFEFAAPPK